MWEGRVRVEGQERGEEQCGQAGEGGFRPTRQGGERVRSTRGGRSSEAHYGTGGRNEALRSTGQESEALVSKLKVTRKDSDSGRQG